MEGIWLLRPTDIQFCQNAVTWTIGTSLNAGSLLPWGTAWGRCRWPCSLAAPAIACGRCSSAAGSPPAPSRWSHRQPASCRTQHQDCMANLGSVRRSQKGAGGSETGDVSLQKNCIATISHPGLLFPLFRILQSGWKGAEKEASLLIKCNFLFPLEFCSVVSRFLTPGS